MSEIFYALVTGHIFLDDDGDKELEILHQVDSNKEHLDIFDDIDHALVDEIAIGNSEDYYFTALIESRYVVERGLDYTEYEAEHHVTEIKSFQDLKWLQKIPFKVED